MKKTTSYVVWNGFHQEYVENRDGTFRTIVAKRAFRFATIEEAQAACIEGKTDRVLLIEE